MPICPCDDVEIYYEEKGEGFPLICIPGLGGTVASWAMQSRAFSEHFRMITLDNRGVGQTRLRLEKPFDLKTMANDVAALMDYLEIGKAHILGFSMGGRIAQHFALQHADRIERLVLGATAATIRHMSRYVFGTFNQLSARGLPYEMRQRLLLPWLFSNNFFSEPERVEQYIQTRLANLNDESESLLAQFKAIYDYDAFVDVAKINCPTYLIVGEEDAITPVPLMRYIHDKIVASKLDIIAGGHCIHIENAKVFNERVLSFLQGRNI